MFAFAKNKIARLAALALLALPLGYGVLQPAQAQAAWFNRVRPIYRPIYRPVVPVAGPVVTVGPVAPIAPVYSYYPGWYWNGFRWVLR